MGGGSGGVKAKLVATIGSIGKTAIVTRLGKFVPVFTTINRNIFAGNIGQSLISPINYALKIIYVHLENDSLIISGLAIIKGLLGIKNRIGSAEIFRPSIKHLVVGNFSVLTKVIDDITAFVNKLHGQPTPRHIATCPASIGVL